MFPDLFSGLPLHPAVVHLPIGLVAVLPLITIVFAVLWRMRLVQKSAVTLIILLHVVLVGVTYFAEETGEEEEHTVERVVDKHHIEEHEERAEVFMGASVAAMLFSAVLFFLPKGKMFSGGLNLLIVVQLVLNFLAYRVGHSGGELVYKHGAASAYIKEAPVKAPPSDNNHSEEEH